jgi:hypothetical protein
MLIDPKNQDLLVYPWSIDANGWVFYNQWVGKQPRRILLHRLVAERMVGHPLTSKDRVKHRNGNKEDNREENLVVNDYSRQGQARKKLPGRSSRYIGVSYWPQRDKWRAKLTYRKYGEKVHVSLGLWETEKDAAKAYNQEVVKHYPDPKLNLIDD